MSLIKTLYKWVTLDGLKVELPNDKCWLLFKFNGEAVCVKCQNRWEAEQHYRDVVTEQHEFVGIFDENFKSL